MVAFTYFCKACEVTGWTKFWPPDARCWNCDRGDSLIPETFMLSSGDDER